MLYVNYEMYCSVSVPRRYSRAFAGTPLSELIVSGEIAAGDFLKISVGADGEPRLSVDKLK